MRGIMTRPWARIIYAVAGIPLLGAYWPWEYTRVTHPVNIPVSLAVGHVRTPVFKVVKDRYIILIVTKKRLPFGEMCCKVGISTDPREKDVCNADPLIEAKWTVWNDQHIVAKGESKGFEGGFFSNTDMGRYLGDFYGEAGKKYFLDVEFTKDGTALAVTDPHLNVEISNASYMAP
jgi:hypothetical protein